MRADTERIGGNWVQCWANPVLQRCRRAASTPRIAAEVHPPLNSRLAGENVLVDLGRIAEHDEANVAHVLLRDPLYVGR